MLRFTDVNLELISGIEKYQFIETVIIGDISMICRVTVEANNKFLKSYHANKPVSYTIYLDANNVYRLSMKHLLKTKRLSWVNPNDFNLDNCSNDSPIICFL